MVEVVFAVAVADLLVLLVVGFDVEDEAAALISHCAAWNSSLGVTLGIVDIYRDSAT